MATKTAVKKTARKKALFKRTISKELFTQWQKMAKSGDIRLLMEETKLSNPTLVRALTYGHCPKQKTIDAINLFYSNRIAQQKEQAEQFELQAD